jgi:heme/copper-type cytochrome/quinol oxidase subunit 2
MIVMLSVVMQNVIILSVVMLNVIMLSVVMLSVVAPRGGNNKHSDLQHQDMTKSFLVQVPCLRLMHLMRRSPIDLD